MLSPAATLPGIRARLPCGLCVPPGPGLAIQARPLAGGRGDSAVAAPFSSGGLLP